MEVIYVNCIYITLAGSRHTALPRCKGAGEGCLHVTPGGKRKIFIEDCLCTMKDYILEAVALISLPGCPRSKELAWRTTFLHHTPRDPLTLCRALPHRQTLAQVISLALSSPVISCLSPSEGQAQTTLAAFSQFRALTGLQHTLNGFCKPWVSA